MLLYENGVKCNLNNNYMKSGRTLRPIFYVLEYFHRKFANLIAPPTDGTTKRIVPCKAHLVL